MQKNFRFWLAGQKSGQRGFETKKDGVKVQLGHVELGETANWTHNGEEGSLLFPVSWLRFRFSGMELHVIAPELQYVLKEHPETLNPDWQPREKDILDKKYLRDILPKKELTFVHL